MTDKYSLQKIPAKDRCVLPGTYAVFRDDIYLGQIITTDINIVDLIDKCLNQTSRAGSKTSQAKRDAAKRNIAKRWEK
jgi:hypothetical protein